MNYIFCPSYSSVFFALYLKNSGKEITIITDNISIKKYCKIADIYCIYFDYVSVSLTKFYRIGTLSSRVDNLIKKIEIKKRDPFYLLDNSYDINSFYLAKKWSKKGNVYFKNLGKTFDAYKNNYLKLSFLTKTSLRYLLRLFLDLNLILLETDRAGPDFGINDKFLRKNKIKILSLKKKLNEMQLDAMRKSHINLKEYDNLIATDGMLSGIIPEASSIKVHRELLQLPYKYVVKFHPRVLKTQELEKYEKLFSNCDVFPDYIPVELLFNNIRKNVISIFSTSLISASQLDNLKAISLLELVDWINPSYKEEIKAWLIKESHNRIIFVKTFDELNNLLGA